jgi:hypothetical protein
MQVPQISAGPYRPRIKHVNPNQRPSHRKKKKKKNTIDIISNDNKIDSSLKSVSLFVS